MLNGRNSFTIVHVQIILHCIIVCDLSSYDLYRRSPLNNPVAETAQVRRLLTFLSCINVVAYVAVTPFYGDNRRRSTEVLSNLRLSFMMIWRISEHRIK